MCKSSEPDNSEDTNLSSAKDPVDMASIPESSAAALDKLATDHPEIAAKNTRTPQRTLERLAQHESAEVRGAIGENTNTPAETLRSLAEDVDPGVRNKLAENPHTPVAVLESLAEDTDPIVYATANDSLETYKSLSSRADELYLKDRFSEAEQLYEVLVKQLEELLGPDNYQLVPLLRNKAAALIGQNKRDEALALEQRASLIESKHIG